MVAQTDSEERGLQQMNSSVWRHAGAGLARVGAGDRMPGPVGRELPAVAGSLA